MRFINRPSDHPLNAKPSSKKTKKATVKKPVQKCTVKFNVKPPLVDIKPEIGLKVMKAKLKYKDVEIFCHCSKCLDKYMKSTRRLYMSPKEALSYEMGSIPFTYPDGTTVGIMALFCKDCGSVVWDSRHLTSLF